MAGTAANKLSTIVTNTRDPMHPPALIIVSAPDNECGALLSIGSAEFKVVTLREGLPQAPRMLPAWHLAIRRRLIHARSLPRGDRRNAVDANDAALPANCRRVAGGWSARLS
jgi:hypothetical protein